MRAGYKWQRGNPNFDPWNTYYWWDYTATEYYPYVPKPRYSFTATLSNNLRTFLVQGGYGTTVGIYGPAIAAFDPAGMFKGDVFFYDWQNNGTIDHVNMMVGTGLSSDGWNGDYINSHTSNRWHVYWTLITVNSQWVTTKAIGSHINNVD